MKKELTKPELEKFIVDKEKEMKEKEAKIRAKRKKQINEAKKKIEVIEINRKVQGFDNLEKHFGKTIDILLASISFKWNFNDDELYSILNNYKNSKINHQ